MPTDGDGVEHQRTPRSRIYESGESRVGYTSDSYSQNAQVADIARERLHRVGWRLDEQDSSRIGRTIGNDGPIYRAVADRSDVPRLDDGAVRDTSGRVLRLDHTQPVSKLVESGMFRQSMHAFAGNPVAIFNPERRFDTQPHQPGTIVQATELFQQRQGERMVAAPQEAARAGDRQIRDPRQSPVRDVEVRYSNTPTLIGDPPQQRPDFRVRRDGSVEVLHNPDRNTRDRVVVEVERAPGAAGRGAPPPEQQAAVDRLVGYIANRYMQHDVGNNGEIRRRGHIQDDQGLVSDTARRSAHTEPTAVEQLPGRVREQVEHINRHGGRGEFSAREAAREFAPRAVPRQQGETDKIAALKDLGSGFLTRNEGDPYHAVQRWPEQGNRVGRYGISARNYQDWLKSMSPEELQRMEQSGRLPRGAAELQQALMQGRDPSSLSGDAQALQNFLTRMQSGQNSVSRQEIDHFLGRDLQERMGSDLVKHYALATADRDSQGRPAAVNVAKVALSMVLGHAVTDDEARQPQNRALMDAAMRQYALAVRHEQNPRGALNMSDAAGRIAAVGRADLGKPLWQGDLPNGNLGCASSVSRVLREAGVANIRELSVVGLDRKLRGMGFTAHNFNDRRPGDVIIVTGGARRGHTGVVGENTNVTYNNHSSSGRWSADNPQYWVRRASGQRLYVLRAPGSA